MPHFPRKSLALFRYNYIIDIIARKFIFFSFFFKKTKLVLYFFRIFVQFTINQLITYRNTIIIIEYLYCYYNWWQLASENSMGTLCVVSGHIVFFFSIFYLYTCTESVYFILLCNMSNKILPYYMMAEK